MRLVTEFLLERLEGKYQGPPRNVAIHGELVIRESTAPVRESTTCSASRDHVADKGGVVPIMDVVAGSRASRS
jgi:hypothetical protein